MHDVKQYPMTIDLIFLLLMVFALVKGLQRGLIVAVFSVIACFLGLAAAIKGSAVLARHLTGTLSLSSRWLPILTFVFIFLVVLIVVRWIAHGLEAVVKLALLEWINKLGAVALYVLLYAAIYSIVLFYLSRSGLLTDTAIRSSRVYPVVEPWGPAVVNGFARVVPFFKDMFSQLEDFFAGVSHKFS